MDYIIRKADMSQLDEIMKLFSAARESIAALGIPQWQNGYPGHDVITEDIAQKQSYVVTYNGVVKASFVLIGHEPDYDNIYEGSWRTDGTAYTALHRVAVMPSCRGGEITGKIMRFVKEYARAQSCASIRCDTHSGNIPMRKMLEKNDFRYCGIIYLKKSLEKNDPDYLRVGYEYIL